MYSIQFKKFLHMNSDGITEDEAVHGNRDYQV